MFEVQLETHPLFMSKRQEQVRTADADPLVTPIPGTTREKHRKP